LRIFAISELATLRLYASQQGFTKSFHQPLRAPLDQLVERSRALDNEEAPPLAVRRAAAEPARIEDLPLDDLRERRAA